MHCVGPAANFSPVNLPYNMGAHGDSHAGCCSAVPFVRLKVKSTFLQLLKSECRSNISTMRVTNVHTLTIEDLTLKERPPNAILSHTWGDDEISYHTFCAGGQLSGEGYDKIIASCRLALEHGYIPMD